MEVCVIKPASMEDTREIADTLLAGCTVVLNLEGIDVDIAQRIIDFCCAVQEGCGQLPVKGQDSHTEPAAHEGIGNALDAHARLPVV